MKQTEGKQAMVIGNNIQKARNGLGWKCISQRDVTSAIGLSATGYSNIENGKSIPRVTDLLKIAKFFNVEIGILLEGVEV